MIPKVSINILPLNGNCRDDSVSFSRSEHLLASAKHRMIQSILKFFGLRLKNQPFWSIMRLTHFNSLINEISFSHFNGFVSLGIPEASVRGFDPDADDEFKMEGPENQIEMSTGPSDSELWDCRISSAGWRFFDVLSTVEPVYRHSHQSRLKRSCFSLDARLR